MLSEDVWGCIHPILHGAAFPENLDIVAAVIQGLDSLDLQLCFHSHLERDLCDLEVSSGAASWHTIYIYCVSAVQDVFNRAVDKNDKSSKSRTMQA